MTAKIYIEALNNFPIADWGVSALLGFRSRGADIIFFEDIEEVPTSKWNIVVACIETTNKYFERFGMPPKKALNIPDELNQWKYLRRAIKKTTMGDLREHAEGYIKTNNGIFVKPDGRAKEFIGGVVEAADRVPIFFKDIADDCPILLSEPVKFVSEYRGYVIDGQLVGLYWYIGDFRIFPDVAIIEEAIKDYTSQPAGYSIDFGVTDKGETLLIECNDGWSLGNYGLDAGKYSKLLARRWMEIMKTY
jgi:hypothetical protein